MKKLGFILLTLWSLSLFAQTKQEALNLKFDQIEVAVDGHKIKVWVAETPRKQQVGLMYRRTLGENEGMLFVFDKSEQRNFWMKNTYVPLSIGFFDQQGKLLNVLEMEPEKSVMQQEYPQYKSLGPARLALEMKSGWFAKKNIRAGSYIKLLSKDVSAPIRRAF